MGKGLKLFYHLMLFASAAVALLSGSRTLYYFFVLLLVIRLISVRVIKSYKENIILRSSADKEVLTSGDTLKLTYRLTNASMLPLWHGKLKFVLPEQIVAKGLKDHGLFLGPQETLPFTIELNCPLRGYYELGQAEVIAYDPMGFSAMPLSFDRHMDLTVFPKVVPLPTLLFEPKAEGGNLKAQERAMDDRTHLMNLRDYVKGDDLKNIHWKLSAKKDQLIVREFHKSMAQRLTVFMDGFYGNWSIGLDVALEEKMVSFCASYLKGASDSGLEFTLHLNNSSKDVYKGNRSDSMQGLMALLTAFRSDGAEDFETFISHEMSKAEVFEHVVFIVPKLTSSLIQLLSSVNVTYDLYALTATDDAMIHPQLKLIEPLMGGDFHETY